MYGENNYNRLCRTHYMEYLISSVEHIMDHFKVPLDLLRRELYK